jgi:hypothetical protein
LYLLLHALPSSPLLCGLAPSWPCIASPSTPVVTSIVPCDLYPNVLACS